MKTITKKITVNAKGTDKVFSVVAKRGYETEKVSDLEDGMTYNTRRIVWRTSLVCEVKGQTIKSESNDFILDSDVPAKYANLGVVAIFAKKVALFKSEYEELKKVIEEADKEAETDEGWQQYLVNQKEIDQMEADFEARELMIKKVMDA